VQTQASGQNPSQQATVVLGEYVAHIHDDHESAKTAPPLQICLQCTKPLAPNPVWYPGKTITGEVYQPSLRIQGKKV
jgi:hypothetical protein